MSINIDVVCELCGMGGNGKTASLPDGFVVLVLGEPGKKPLREFVLCGACVKLAGQFKFVVAEQGAAG